MNKETIRYTRPAHTSHTIEIEDIFDCQLIGFSDATLCAKLRGDFVKMIHFQEIGGRLVFKYRDWDMSFYRAEAVKSDVRKAIEEFCNEHCHYVHAATESDYLEVLASMNVIIANTIKELIK